VLPHGALGVGTGVIAIGTVATLKSTTIITTIRTTISTATSAARDKVIGSTTHNTGAMHPMETGRRRISLAGKGLAARVVGSRVLAPEDPVVPAVPEDPAVLAAPVALVVPENPVVPVVPEDPAEPLARVALVAPENPVVPAVLELETVPVAVLERELDQVAVMLVRDHLRARLAEALKTKSVTAARRPGLVPLLTAGEDLAAAGAETTRALAAAEAVIA
jgi:hypothetical protein